MEKEQYKELLQSVGVETFVKYYGIFKTNRQSRSNESIKETFRNGKENWNENAINTKASCGKKIFQISEELNALAYIVNESKVSNPIKDDAIKLLQSGYKELLKSIGIGTFVKYYDDFKTNKDESSNELIYNAFNKNKEQWTKGSCNTKASKGKKIFQIEKEENALLYIINESSRVPKSIKELAKKILNK
jgi:hypothetical protein